GSRFRAGRPFFRSQKSGVRNQESGAHIDDQESGAHIDEMTAHTRRDRSGSDAGVPFEEMAKDADSADDRGSAAWSVGVGSRRVAGTAREAPRGLLENPGCWRVNVG